MAPTASSRNAGGVNLAYILSANYSGSTLLAMLLGSQPEAFTMGEMRVPALQNPDTYRCSCGELIKQCGFWNEVSKRMAQKGIAGFTIVNPRLSIHDVESPYVTRLLNAMPRGPVLEGVRSAALSFSPAWSERTCVKSMRATRRWPKCSRTCRARVWWWIHRSWRCI